MRILVGLVVAAVLVGCGPAFSEGQAQQAALGEGGAAAVAAQASTSAESGAGSTAGVTVGGAGGAGAQQSSQASSSTGQGGQACQPQGDPCRGEDYAVCGGGLVKDSCDQPVKCSLMCQWGGSCGKNYRCTCHAAPQYAGLCKDPAAPHPVRCSDLSTPEGCLPSADPYTWCSPVPQ